MRNCKGWIVLAVAVLSVLPGITGCVGTGRGEDSGKDKVQRAEQRETGKLAVAEAAGGEEERGCGAWFRDGDMVKGEVLDFCGEYAALVEGALEGQAFGPAVGGKERELQKMLLGHYEVAGRSSGEGREYYLAVRREDAPVYGDFGELSVGDVDEVCQIGYHKEDKEDDEETVLYQVPGWSVIVPDDGRSAGSLDVLCFLNIEEKDPAFLALFSEGGRKQLGFMKKHKGLSFHEEGKACMDFLYQDEDTVGFWSEPYPCCIGLDEESAGQLRQLLRQEGSGRQEKVFGRYGDALDYVRTLDSSIRTTGAGFHLDGREYQLLGSRGQEGYLLSWEETEEGRGEMELGNYPEAWKYVRGRILECVGRDYGDFTDTWFDVPLVRASLEFPRREESEEGKLRFEACVQEVEEPEKLKELSRIMGNAIRGPEVISGCPYQGILKLVREDGETLEMFVASDSCDSVAYEGRIGFEYGRQEELAAIFQEAMGTGN